nr:MAG TPA: hypothetical protein [Bacteriophage sp.]
MTSGKRCKILFSRLNCKSENMEYQYISAM